MNILVTLLLLGGPARAQATWCSESYRSDTYALGVGKGFMGRLDVLPAVTDDLCMRMGLQVGAQVRAENLDDIVMCEEAFAKASSEAQAALPNSRGTAETCSDAGYAYGQAVLRTRARNGDTRKVAASCVAHYLEGKQDGISDKPLTMPNEVLDAACYQTGYDDGERFRGLL